MKALIVTDIHANLVALEAVLAVCGEIDEIWNLGDTVGYGPRPSECIDRVVEAGADPILVGNHDLACIGEIDDREFNVVARAASRWTASQLRENQKFLLSRLPARIEHAGFTLAHGSPRDPIWEYLTDEWAATTNFAAFESNVCFVGHSHLPMIFHLAAGEEIAEMQGLAEDQVVDLSDGRFIINPGGLGQPRDLDPRAAFGLLDTGQSTFTGKRIEYDIEATQRQMAEAHLPDLLIRRLAIGR